MNSSNIAEWYDYAFKLLEYGKNLEGAGRHEEAYQQGYGPACVHLRQLYDAEVDLAKKNLLVEQISFFEGKINQYYQKQTLQPPACTVPLPSPPPVEDKGKLLRDKADSLYREAVKYDKGPPRAHNSRAEERYLKAAELYIQATKVETNSFKESKDQMDGITARVSSILDRVAQMKGQDQQGKGNSTEPSDDIFLAEFDDVLPTIDPSRPLAKKSVAAGDIKSDIGARIRPTGSEASGSGDLKSNEIEILRRSSFINGRCFLPWMDDEKTEQFAYPRGKLFTDPDGFLPFSQSQISKQARYKRIHEIVASSASGRKKEPVLIKTVSPLAITQDLVADCSFVCSLCIAAALEARLQKKLITSIIYPQNDNGVPVYNPSGKYLVKLFMNGVMRKVVIDDYLPVETHKNNQGQEVYHVLCSYSTDPTEMWISLVEKAYMKLNGGYDFPGSNSGIDLHALTGWIPEQVFFEEDRTFTGFSSSNKPLDNRQRENDVWERIVSAHKFGDCLITISTSSKLSKEMEEATGLVPGHAYAVLNVCKAGNLRMLQVKNPWARRSWKGKFSSRDRDRWTPGLKAALGVADGDFDKMDKQGIFWIDFSDCREYFKSFFLNWNPSLFMFRTAIHDMWPVNVGPKIDTFYIGASPQYSLIVQGSSGGRNGDVCNGVGTSIWILLSRHVVSKDIDPDSLTPAQAAALRDDETFLTMHIYKNGRRIYAPSKPMIRGVYSSDPHVLSRIDISDEESKSAYNDVSLEFPLGRPIEYTLVLSQSEKLRDVYYSISVYSTVLPFQLQPCPPIPSNQLTLTGSWKAGLTAGGNVNSRLFHINPQYRLHIPPVVRGGIDMHIHAMCSKDISASISVVDVIKNNNWQKNKASNENEDKHSYARIDCIASDDAEILTSGSYRNGYCVCSTSLKSEEESTRKQSNGKSKSFHLQAGDYTVVVSAYTPDSIGNFALTFATSAGAVDDSSSGTAAGVVKPKHVRKYFTVKEIPAEGAGLKHIIVNGEWSDIDQTAAGCVNFGSYHTNPIYYLHLPQECVFAVRLNIELKSGLSGVALNISLFDVSKEVNEDVGVEDANDGKTEQKKPQLTESYVDCSKTLRDMSASATNAALSSNGGVYVIRPTGAFIAPVLLKPGTYLLVPSTFKQRNCKYVADVYLTPSVCSSADFKFTKAV